MLPAESAEQADLLLALDSRSSSSRLGFTGCRAAKAPYLFTALVSKDLDRQCTWLHLHPCPMRSCSDHPSPLAGARLFALSPSASLGTNGFFDLSQDLPENQDFSLGLCCVMVTLDPLINTKMTKMAQRWDGRPRDLFCMKRLRPSCCQPGCRLGTP